jgi:hydrogenase maturation protein HypF
MAACMAEHQIASPVIGCILDGTGYGPDGKLWGFEILTGDYVDFERVIHLKPIRLPGGEAAIRNPWMTGLSLLYEAVEGNTEIFSEWALNYFPQYKAQLPIILAQLSGRLPAPEASSVGRLFDGISAILNVCTESSYDGEAAMCLSEIMETEQPDQDSIRWDIKYPFNLTNDQWDIAPMVKQLHQDIKNGLSLVEMVYKYHHTVACMVLDGVRKAHLRTGISQVVLSGGVWNNRYLQAITKLLLAQEGFHVYSHNKVPAGDGGIALGQAVCGIWRWAKDHVLIGTVDGS